MKLKLPYPYTGSIECPKHLEKILRASFPDYRGRKFRLDMTEAVHCSDTYWDGGSRSQYVGVNLATGKLMPLPDLISGGYAPHADAFYKLLSSVPLKPGLAIVRHSIFCGKDAGLTIHLHPADGPKSLLAAEKQTLLTSDALCGSM